MGVFHNPNDLAAAQIARGRANVSRLKFGHREMANTLYKEADGMLSGSTSTAELIADGHPFGRRDGINGNPGRQRKSLATGKLMPTLPINEQTGKLRQALRLAQRNTGTAQIFVLSVSKSIAPYAKYILALGGTVKMVSRPFWQTLFKSWKRKNFELLVEQKQANSNP